MEKAINNVVVIANDKESFGIVSNIKIPVAVATELAAHAKDKITRIQKKTSLPLKHGVVPVEGDKSNFISRLAVVTKNIIEVDVICGVADVLTELHRQLITAALLPTVTGNLLKDLKPLEEENEAKN